MSFAVDAWRLMLKPEKFDVETIEPSGITGTNSVFPCIYNVLDFNE